MRAGRMRTKLVIQQLPAAPARDAAGGEVKDWQPLFSAWWCELVQVRGGETFRNRVVSANANHVATGRYVAGVTTKMRAVYGARLFDVVAVNNPGDRRRELILDLLERL